MEMSQETRKRQNDFLAARGSVVPHVGTELDPVPYVNFVLPPLMMTCLPVLKTLSHPLSQKVLMEMKMPVEKKNTKALLFRVKIFEL
jgi:hypothetical protein